MKRSPMKRSTSPMRRPRRLKSRFSAEDQQWSREVRERDGHQCRRCGGRGTQAHHIAPKGRRPDLRLVLSNGVCLCNDCHRWVHEHPRESTAAGLLSGEKYEARHLFDYQPAEPEPAPVMTGEQVDAFRTRCRAAIIRFQS